MYVVLSRVYELVTEYQTKDCFHSPLISSFTHTPTTMSGIDESPVLTDLRRHLTGNSSPAAASATIDLEHRTAIALPVAAIKSLLGVIQRSKANTMMGLQEDLRGATEEMMTFATESHESWHVMGGRSHIALASGCELFMK